MPDIAELDLAYAAGLIDGEGTIGITELKPSGKLRKNGRRERKSPQHRIYVACTMTDELPIVFLHMLFGGNIQSLKSRGANHKPTFRWSATSLIAAEFCEAIAPYLKIKKAQAEITSRFFRERLQGNFQGNSGVPIDELALRRVAVQEIRTLNYRGVAAVEG